MPVSALKTQRTQLGRQIAILRANSILKQMKPWLRSGEMLAWQQMATPRQDQQTNNIFEKTRRSIVGQPTSWHVLGHTRCERKDTVPYPSFSDTSLAHISSQDRRSSVKTKRMRGKTTGCLYTQESRGNGKTGDYFQEKTISWISKLKFTPSWLSLRKARSRLFSYET